MSISVWLVNYMIDRYHIVACHTYRSCLYMLQAEAIYISNLVNYKVTGVKLANVPCRSHVKFQSSGINVDLVVIIVHLLLPGDNLHPSAPGLKKMMSNLNLSDKTKPAFDNGPTKRWQTQSLKQPLIPDAWQIPLTTQGPTPRQHGYKSRPAKPIKFKGGRSSFTPMPQNPPHRDMFGQTRPNSRNQQLCCFNCGEISHNANKCFDVRPLKCHMCFG